jgi:3-keto-5-aminohexanoate cleavage enzyme
MKKLIITAALTGSVPRKDRFPQLPVTVDEIIEDAIRCYNAGAAIVHIHVRDKKTGNSGHDEDQFRAIKEGINEKCPDLIVQLSGGGRFELDDYMRNSSLRCHPEMATWTPGSVGFPTGAYISKTEFYTEQARYMFENNIKPEVECFDTHMVNNAIKLHKKGLLKSPIYFDFVMGVENAQVPTIHQLSYLLSMLPEDSEWNIAGVGPNQAKTIMWGMGSGGHVRVGMEDNQFLYKGAEGDNPKFVERVVRIAKEVGREVASCEDARALLGLPPRKRA